MPDIFDIIRKQGKLIGGLTLAATLLAIVVSLLRQKEYLSTVTALPANSLTADKARIFNGNIEALYSELGGPDELDRIEGTAQLDTIFLAVAKKQNLAAHYGLTDSLAIQHAAGRLRKQADIRRSAYGELKIKVWDKEPAVAAQLSNGLLAELNDLHQHIRTTNNERVLQSLRYGLQVKEQEMLSLETGASTLADSAGLLLGNIVAQQQSAAEQARLYRSLIHQYELALNTAQQPLIVVEAARPSLNPDRPKLLQTAVFAFGASLVFSFLLALLLESRLSKSR